MTRGEKATLYAMLLFASAGVGTWALTLPPAALFGLGCGWGLVLGEILEWAQGRAS